MGLETSALSMMSACTSNTKVGPLSAYTKMNTEYNYFLIN